MRGYANWNYKPWVQANARQEAVSPCIRRIAPGDTTIQVEWFDLGDAGEHVLQYRQYHKFMPWKIMRAEQGCVEISGLTPDVEYEFQVARADGSAYSPLRLARTGAPEGVVINYLHPEDSAYLCSGRYLGSPSIVRLPSGALIAGHDIFNGGASNLSQLFKSVDDGKTWRYVTDIVPSFWPNLFLHRGALYLLSADTEYGTLMIGRSDDEGETWSAPVRLFQGGNFWGRGYHKGAVPVIEHEGRLYTGVEYGNSPDFPLHAALLSIDASADLLVPENWSLTEPLAPDYHWPGMPQSDYGYYMEGNAVVAPDGTICDMMRLDPLHLLRPAYNQTALLRGDKEHPEKQLEFVRVTDMPVGVRNKFCLRKDPQTGLYFAMGNETGPEYHTRTVLSLSVSEDLVHWRVLKRVLDYHLHDANMVAYQYPNFIFDGDDLLYVCRTAWNQAHNFHDSNFITFHRLKNFRDLLSVE